MTTDTTVESTPGEPMHRTFVIPLIVLCVLIAAKTEHTQEEGNLGSLNQPGTPFSQLFESIQPVLTKTLKTYLDFLAQPQTGEKIATFQKHYDDALMKQGFSKIKRSNSCDMSEIPLICVLTVAATEASRDQAPLRV